jgi:nucleotidyltransferase AbiEii toxin of type IV toxin-antitoxin system
MSKLLRSARQLQDFCDAQDWRFCFIGGIAVMRWAEPRVTRDLDITLLTGFGQEDSFIQPLLAAYLPRIENAAEFARRQRVLLVKTPDDIGIDISLGALPFEELAVNRATAFEFDPGLTIRTCSAEDLIVLKLFASRPLDIRDAEGVVVRHRERLDWRYIEDQLGPLVEVKQDPTILDTLARLRQMP